MTEDVFKEVLESCRRDRLPIGETLVAWGVVTKDDVRDALLHQIRGAIATLDAASTARTLFLEREKAFASYAPELTFAIDSVLPPPADPADTPCERLLRLAAGLPSAIWCDRYIGDAISARDCADLAFAIDEVERRGWGGERFLLALRRELGARLSREQVGVLLPGVHAIATEARPTLPVPSPRARFDA